MLKYFKLLALLLFVTPVYADGLIVPPPKLPLSVVNGGTGVTTSTGSGNNVLSTSPVLTTPSLGVATATSINGAVINNTAWATYTPTVTAAAGTITSYSATGRYKSIGKTTFIQLSITLTTVGSASGALIATLPNVPANVYSLSGIEAASTAISLSAVATNTGTTSVRKYDGTTVFVNGYNIIVSGVYESQ